MIILRQTGKKMWLSLNPRRTEVQESMNASCSAGSVTSESLGFVAFAEAVACHGHGHTVTVNLFKCPKNKRPSWRKYILPVGSNATVCRYVVANAGCRKGVHGVFYSLDI